MDYSKGNFLVTILSVVIGGVLIAALCVLLLAIIGIGDSPGMLVFAIIIVTAILFGIMIGVFKIYKLTAEHHERMAMLEAGQILEVPETGAKNNLLISGTILLALGLAILFSLYLFKSAILLLAFVPGFIGLALLFIQGINELKKVIPPEKDNQKKS